MTRPEVVLLSAISIGGDPGPKSKVSEGIRRYPVSCNAELFTHLWEQRFEVSNNGCRVIVDR